MHFQVSRNGQMYGPYTLDDMQRYLASGNILPTDLAKSEDMPDWLPVAQILGQAPTQPPIQPPVQPPTYPQDPSLAIPSESLAASPFTATTPTPYPSPIPYPAPTASALAASRYPDPPNLHWGLVLLISVFTNGLFLIIWEFVQCAWLKKVQPDATALKKYITAYGLIIGGLIIAIIAGAIIASTNQPNNTPVAGILIALVAVACYFGGFIMVFVARFSERASLEQHFNSAEPIGLRLSGVMTFFFGGFYFQYHLNRINTLKQAARLGVPAVY